MAQLGGVESPADVCLIGSESEIRAELQAYANAGLTDFLAAPDAGGGDRTQTWNRTAELLGSLAGDF